MKKIPDEAMDRIERILGINKEISLLSVEKNRLTSEVSEVISPFKAGDIVECKNGTRVRKVKVICAILKCTSEIRDFSPDRLNFRVQNILKNGSLGKESMMYSWDNPKLISRKEETEE